jgi:hypothetical protein
MKTRVMEQKSQKVEVLKYLVNDLYAQESQHLNLYPFREIKDIMPYLNKGKDDFEFLKAFMFPGK